MARELGRISLAEALEPTILIARNEPRRLPRVAVRWLERYLQECDPTLAQVALSVSIEGYAQSARRSFDGGRDPSETLGRIRSMMEHFDDSPDRASADEDAATA
jgi:hypothetical protein